ncbi:hypothetical protein [Lonomia obliqua multiple nucleopolyhedrovirus]|uniref:SNF2 N-terminal domain-containing protein n=1 Tax=Lonomia obliqua multiple nucleopolyhedrovirus TaxID=134394 RepID=A0A126FC36_9ABAC|nr:hypothetical protein [Lonomia obliqua multiple nucleopolyhedrovirus]AKN80961.1 hypothetical protein [Lonomia obliqua multiple nucleopolyhedrovirus]
MSSLQLLPSFATRNKDCNDFTNSRSIHGFDLLPQEIYDLIVKKINYEDYLNLIKVYPRYSLVHLKRLQLSSKPSLEALNIQQPTLLNNPMNCFQLKALAWTRWRETQEFSGGIFAFKDNEHINRIYNVIALIVSEKEKNNYNVKNNSTLIFLNHSNSEWLTEINKATTIQALTMCHHYDPLNIVFTINSYDLVFTTYKFFKKTINNDINKNLLQYKWKRVIFDQISRRNLDMVPILNKLQTDTRWCITNGHLMKFASHKFILFKLLKCPLLHIWNKSTSPDSPEHVKAYISTYYNSIVLNDI